ncbi:hypothetical protein ACJRO7_012915 [Eucalyptus globulus]|uniref:Uncharacterized protein n=1 Tax=Eucalyptus globulus TaxID=34317 RepID=A0ABD3LPG3_EUCGL
MEAKMSQFFGSVSDFFTGADHIPWCDRDVIAGCEREIAEAEKASSDELLSECIMRLSWALVHSRQPEDVQRGIAMLEASVSGTTSPLQLREQLYLLAVGYYRSGDYTKSRDLVERCLRVRLKFFMSDNMIRVLIWDNWHWHRCYCCRIAGRWTCCSSLKEEMIHARSP